MKPLYLKERSRSRHKESKHSAEHGIAFGRGVHTSTYPLLAGGTIRPKEDRWESLPNGWTDASRDKFYKSITSECGGKEGCECESCQAKEGPVSTCIDKMGGKVDDPGAFCAALTDRVKGTTNWRGKKEEADSGSANTAVLRDDKKKESSIKAVKIRTGFREGRQSQMAPRKFQVILIQEGLGNLNDCFYYTKDCLKNAAPLFEGKKCFADHPSKFEEEVLPERSTRDILGHYENVRYEEMNERGALVADLKLLPGAEFDWAMSLMTNALDYTSKYPDESFIGFSINASGEAGSVSIDEFMKTTEIPKEALPKLLEAREQGITEIRPVAVLKEAVSCDLVTEAGAGGKIVKMIEQERKRIMKKQKESKKEAEKKEAEKHEAEKKKAEGKMEGEAEKHESEKKEEGESESESEAEKHEEDGSDDEGHDDEEQDKELIQKMLKQYLGDEHQDDKEAMAMAKHAYEAHKEMGMDHEAAYEAAGQHLKMAADIGKRMAAKKDGDGKDQDKDPDHDGDQHDDKPADQEESENESEKKEAQKVPASPGKKVESGTSLRDQLLKANARIAKLEETIQKREVAEYLDKKLKESKLSNKVTTKFREALGQPKSKEHIDATLKTFMSAYSAGVEDSQADDTFVFTEKAVVETSSGDKEVVSFEDCAQ